MGKLSANNILANNKKRCGLFFGSFNPFHIGHLAICNYALEFSSLDELRLVYSPHNPFKDGQDREEGRQHIKSIEHIFELYGFDIKVCDIEFTLPEPLYTINTLRVMQEREPNVEFVLLVGADTIASIYRWHEGCTLLSSYRIMVYPREGYNIQQILDDYSTSGIEVLGVEILDAPLVTVSSTFIRESVAKGINVNGFLPYSGNK